MSYFTVHEHIISGQYVQEYPGATLHNQEDDLKIHIKQYIPNDSSPSQSGAVTIIGAHANGFPKELYEPLWDDLYISLKRHGQAIRSIWIADVVAQGRSGELNENSIGNDSSWYDHSRDLLHMINHFRRNMPRPLMGIGHSMGGTQLVNLALMHPRLLSSVILIDPVIQNTTSTPPSEDISIARLSTFRRDLWPSKAEAAASFKKSRFYQTWDPRVFERYISYGLRELPTMVYPDVTAKGIPSSPTGSSPVTLSTSKHQEVFGYGRPKFDFMNPSGEQVTNRLTHPDLYPSEPDSFPFYRPEPKRMFVDLPQVRPSVLYILGGQSSLSTPQLRKARLDRTGNGVGGSGGAAEGRVKEVVFEDVGHLVAFETVGGVAEAVGGWMAEELKRWRQLEQEWRDQWQAKSKEEKTMITDTWRRNIGGDPRGPGPSKL